MTHFNKLFKYSASVTRAWKLGSTQSIGDLSLLHVIKTLMIPFHAGVPVLNILVLAGNVRVALSVFSV